MARVKGGKMAAKRRRNILKQVKGYRFGRSTKKRAAREAIFHAGAHSFAHRRDKKNVMRRLWNVRINAALRENGLTYSKFIGTLKKKGIVIDRKVLASLASENPESFKRLLSKIS